MIIFRFLHFYLIANRTFHNHFHLTLLLYLILLRARTLLRLLAILLVASCGVISVTNWYDCRFLKYDPSETRSEELIVGSTGIAEFLDRFGSNSSSWYKRNAAEEDYEFGCNYTAIWIGLHQSAAICVVDDESDNKQEYYECQPEYYGVIFPTLSKPRQRMFKAAKLVGLLTPIFSLFGIICAFVEFCFCAFYPSVIIGAIFFSGAALSETTMLIVWYYDTIAW